MAPKTFKELQDRIRDYPDPDLNEEIARTAGQALGKHRAIDSDKARALFLERLRLLFGCEAVHDKKIEVQVPSKIK